MENSGRLGCTCNGITGCEPRPLELLLRVAEINKYTKIAPDFGSASRRANRSILSICNFWRNAEGGLKDKQDCGFI